MTEAPWRSRIVGSGEEEPTQLVANPLNWRTHPGAQRDALRGSLDTVGWVQQVLVNRTTGNVVDGHARVEEAISKGQPTVPVLYVELSEEEERIVLATLDPISAMAGRDGEKIAELLDGLTVDDAALRSLLGDLAGPEGRKGGLTDPDDAPPLREAADVATGEIYALGDHRMLVGDSTNKDEVDRLLDDLVDLVWTDPPYGVAYEGRTEERLKIVNDDLAADATRQLVAGALRWARLKPGGSLYVASPAGPLSAQFSLAISDAGLYHAQTLVWVKDRFVLGRSDFHYRHEQILTGVAPAEADNLAAKDHDDVLYGWRKGQAHHFRGGRKVDSVWEIPRPSRSREHPTMKPVELVARALEFSSVAGDTVYDPFGGSGTTLIASEQLGRRCRTVELDPRYAQVIIERWETFTGRKAERLDG